MSLIKGEINLVNPNNLVEFFLPILSGSNPTAGFAPFTGTSFQITMTGFNRSENKVVSTTKPINSNPANGSFELNEFPTALNVTDVWLNVSLVGQPFYRSQEFEYARAKKGETLSIFLFQPQLKPSDGVTAGVISSALSSAKGLPGDTKLTTTPWGINVVGSQSGADIQFGIKVVADTSSNLALLADLSLENYNVHVGFPADCKTNAHDIVLQIKSSLQSEGSHANGVITNQIVKILENPPVSLTPELAAKLFNLVSFTFSSIVFANNHTWPLSDTTDNTVIMNVSPVVGWPRGWAANT